MPLDEEGAKWSCEPCIRGHRSSKCQHFDRLMMKVPKAGRPLAKCPHPKGTCSCQKTFAFMVRIPKGSSCLCRPLYTVPAGTNDSSQSTPASMASVSSPASAKVQKSGRRQSNIQATPENIAKALEAMPENIKFEDGISNYLPNLPSHQSDQDSPSQNSSHQIASAPQESAKPANGASCCSQKPQPPLAPSQPSEARGSGSCCGGKSSTSISNPIADDMSNVKGPKANQPTSWNDMSYMNFSTHQMPAWHNHMASTQGSFMQSFGMPNTQVQPLYLNGYTANVSSAPYSNSMNGLGITPPNMALLNSNPSQNSTFTSTNLGGDPCHDCKCGDDCQCLGCAAHPFNNTTRQHVQEMGVIMTFDGEEATPDAMANAYQSSSFQSNTATDPMSFFMQPNPSMDHGVHHNSFDPYPDPNSAMPSGYSSPLSAGHHLTQQLMHPSEYYTLEYPVGIPSACSDVTGSCQCGNDCSCVGCVTHSGHNGVPLEAPIPEPSQHHASPRGLTASAGGLASRIPVLENVSVPCLSPRTLETSMI
ncbi:uncharacterized protein N7482_005814 [Penicillium canariense]|uniref:Copper-fist domain-containing protein n=1 Tax=Penicillium canariense TaxID=189055 RepID=A0A9W9LNT2_9EURO|nr:uncharacterized protein N7482_005814 [Penicillium canariense]KAJ5167033.1 hypothetical protein N7482_005814 [Penicillium canariense]